ncbi:hypothetical protein AAMO2058_001151000 [Amorphochlora amoebiformis]
MDAYDPGNPPLNLDFKRRNRCFGRRNRKGIKGPRNPMVVGLAMALGLLLRGPERVGKGRYEKRKVFLGNYGSHTKSWMLLYGGQASPTPPLPANQNTNSEASPTPPVDRNERYSQDELISMYTRVRQAQERNDPNYEKLYDRYLDMENANKPWKGQKDGKKPRKMSKEDIREWEKHLPKDDVYARLFKRDPNEPQDGDPETDAATDIEGDFAIKREWGYSNKPLPPPEEPPPMDPDIHRRAIVQCICLNPRDRPSARVLCDMVEQSQKGVELQRSKTPLGLRMPSSPPTSPTQNPLPRLPQESHASNQHTSPTPVTRDEKTASQYLRRHRRGGSMEETFSLVLTSVFGARDSDGNRAPSGLATASASRSPTRSRQQSASNSNQNQSTDKRDSKRSSGMTLVCMSDSNNPTMSFKSDSASSRAGSREGSPGPILKLRESRRRFDSLRNAHRRTTSGPPERQVGPGTANYSITTTATTASKMGTSMTHFNKGTSMTHFNNSGPTQDGQEYRNLRRIYTEQNPNIPRRRSSEPFICPVLSRATSGPGFVPAPPPPPLTNLSISFVPSYAHTRR